MKSEEEAKIFADRLTGARHLRTLTQAELAEKSGVSLRSVQIWEGGRSNVPRPALLRSVAAVLQVPVPYLLGVAGENSIPDEARISRAESPGPPDWLMDLGRRLGSLPDGTRRRLVDAMHAMLDALEPLQTARGPVFEPPREVQRPHPLPPEAPIRSGPQEHHQEAKSTAGPAYGRRPPRVELSDELKAQMAYDAEVAAGLAPPGGSRPVAKTASPTDSVSPPAFPARPGTSRGSDHRSRAQAESESSSSTPPRPRASGTPNPARSRPDH